MADISNIPNKSLQNQFQIETSLILHQVRMSDVNKMIITALADYFDAIENNDQKKAHEFLQDFYFHCKNLQKIMQNEKFLTNSDEYARVILGEFNHLLESAPATAGSPFILKTGLPSFENLCEYYIGLLKKKEADKVPEIQLELLEKHDKEFFKILLKALGASNGAIDVEATKEELVKSFKFDNLADMVPEEIDITKDTSLAWPRYKNKRCDDFKRFYEEDVSKPC